MLPVLQIGPLAVQLPGLLLLLGVWAGLSLSERSAPRHGVEPNLLSNLVFLGLVVGLVGARLGYAARALDIYLASPLSLVALTPATLSATDGVLAGTLAALVYGQRRGLRLWATLDSLTPGLAVMAVAIGLAHLASGDAFGAPASLPWSVDLWGARRHPSQIYEIVGAASALALTLRLSRARASSGVVFLSFTILTAGARLFLEAFRGDSLIVLGGLREAQLVALAVLLLALVGLHWRASTLLNRG
jgi:phosphatidylglycerol:prolipoprotein diacylglycerol transferase